MKRPLGASVVLETLVSILALSAYPSTAQNFPPIDFEGLGSVAVSGAFDGISVWTPQLANESFNSNTSSLLLRDASGMLTKINETNMGGKINAICQRTYAPNTVYVGGLFHQMAGINASNIASYNPTTKVWNGMNGGLDGEVRALHCDDAHGLIYAGGSFVKPSNVSNVTDTSRYLGGVATWNVTGLDWLPAPFGGVNGSVSEITLGLNSSTLRFTGAFDVGFSSLPPGAPVSGTNRSASPLSIAWAPLPLGQTEFQGGPSSADQTFNDPAQILCPQGLDGPNNTYLFADNSPGRLTMRTFRNLPVRGIRLSNTLYQGRGTNQFSVISIPDNTELELLYLDPVTKKNTTCGPNCPLFHDASIPYQDFLITDNPTNNLTNGVKEMTGLQITVNTWYGNGAGFHMMQLLSDGGYSYAYEGYNRAQCNSLQAGARNVNSNSTHVGAWYHSTVNTNIPGTVTPVLALTDDFSNLAANLDANVTWNVDVSYDGNYSVFLNVPGCTASEQCGQRTVVQARVINNATTLAKPGNWTRVPQNNTLDTSVLIYKGPISKANSTFFPSVQMTIPSDAPAPTTGDRFTVIADRVTMQLVNSNETFQAFQEQGFGLLEYNVFDVNVNNNSLAYGANWILSNTTTITQLANMTDSAYINSTIQALNSTAQGTLLNFTMIGNGTAIVNGTTINGTTIIQQSVQAYIDQITANLYSATEVLPNATMTSLDFFAGTLLSAGVFRNRSESVNNVATAGNLTFVGGSFASSTVNKTAGFANVVSYTAASGGKSYTRLAGGGVNGPVSAMVNSGTLLYVAGNFTATADNTTALGFIGRYDTIANTWAELQGGTNNAVNGLSLVGTQLLVSGIFDTVNGSLHTGSFAVWDTVAERWLNSTAPVVGTISATSTTNNNTYIAGQVESIGSTPAAAAIRLSAPSVQGQYPLINVLNFQFPATTASIKSTPAGAVAAPNAKRSVAVGAPHLHSRSSSVQSRRPALFARLASKASSVLMSRSDPDFSLPSTSLLKTADAMDPPSLSTTSGDEILASAFWKRADGAYLTVFGGNFTTSAGIKNLGIYDPTTSLFNAFPPLPASSNVTVIRSVYIDGNTMYAGGDGGIVVFDLLHAKWNNIPPLTAATGTILSVSAISHRPDSTTMVVAGTFTEAGGLPCLSVCQWDTKALRWSNLGNGVEGQISAIDFAGPKANTLIVAGSTTIDGMQSSMASYTFGETGAAWTNLGSMGLGGGQTPGPGTAMSVDNLNANAIFIAGRSSDGSFPYLAKWDGTTYTDVGSNELLDPTGIAQLTFVGLTQNHETNTVLESNRMLVVSGALSMNSFGNVSSALFDGQYWTPFLLSTQTGGGPGVVRTLTRSVEVLKFGNFHHLAVGIVILISIAIGLGVVFLLVLLGLIWALLFRRGHKKGVNVPVSPSDETLAAAGVAGEKKRPSSLLATLNAATENVMSDHYNLAAAGAGAGVGAAAAAGAGADHHTSSGHGLLAESSNGHALGAAGGTMENSEETGPGGQSSQYHSDGYTGRSAASHYVSGDEGLGSGGAAAGGAVAAGAVGRALGGHENEEDLDGIEAHARYTFEATHPSELGVHAGEKIWILDDQDEHWWLARNESGQTGVLPSTYVL